MEISKTTPGGCSLKHLRQFVQDCDRAGMPDNGMVRIDSLFVFRTDGIVIKKLMISEEVVVDE